jgi:hypothetical protein
VTVVWKCAPQVFALLRNSEPSGQKLDLRQLPTNDDALTWLPLFFGGKLVRIAARNRLIPNRKYDKNRRAVSIGLNSKRASDLSYSFTHSAQTYPRAPACSELLLDFWTHSPALVPHFQLDLCR